ncbi:hypothetical protein MMC20_002784 [Loxospora ochrophaea]|nr:hypothetical protein [Loxospora ochrophaea]
MEATLHGMDKTDNANGDNEYLMSCTSDNERENFPREWPESRTQLMGRMEKKALEYGKDKRRLNCFELSKMQAELLLKTQQLKALDSPSTRDYRSALHFMENDGGQLFEEESGFIYEKHDLISVRPGREHAWLDGIIERVLLALRCKLTRFIFCSKVRTRLGSQKYALTFL